MDHTQAPDFAPNTINEENEHAAQSLAATLAVIKSVGKWRKKSASNVHAADESIFNIATEVPTQSNKSNSQNGNGSSTGPTLQSADQKSHYLVAQTSNNFAQELLDTQTETIATFMLKHKADMAVEESSQIFDVYSNPFRVRRLTFEQEFVQQQDKSKVNSPIEHKSPPASGPLVTKLNVYSASELDDYVKLGLSNGEGESIESVQQAPFPEEYVGTFSCHGMEPHKASSDAGDYDDGGQLCGKINQDRGCVVYPLRYEYQDAPTPKDESVQHGARKRRGSVAVATEDYLFMVLDGHGGQGALVSEFAMRHVRLCVPLFVCLFVCLFLTQRFPIVSIHPFCSSNRLHLFFITFNL